MSDFEVLYYPFYEPPRTWLRSNLLFFDKIRTIAPKNLDYFSDEALELLDNYNVFCKVTPDSNDLSIDENNLSRLDKAFQYINKTEPFLDFENISSCNDVCPDAMFLHQSKVSSTIMSLLKKYKLIDIDGTEEMNKYLSLTHFSVNKKAGELIVSLLADNIARNKGWNTATDKNLDFGLNSLNSLNYNTLDSSKNLLMRSIINCSIPEAINKLELEDFMYLRDEYADIRLLFQQTISELNNINNLEYIPNPSQLCAKIDAITKDFDYRVDDIKMSTPHKKMKFISFSLGFLSVCSYATPSVAVPSALASMIIGFIGNSDYIRSYSDEKSIHRMVSGLQNDIDQLTDINAVF